MCKYSGTLEFSNSPDIHKSNTVFFHLISFFMRFLALVFLSSFLDIHKLFSRAQPLPCSGLWSFELNSSGFRVIAHPEYWSILCESALTSGTHTERFIGHASWCIRDRIFVWLIPIALGYFGLCVPRIRLQARIDAILYNQSFISKNYIILHTRIYSAFYLRTKKSLEHVLVICIKIRLMSFNVILLKKKKKRKLFINIAFLQVVGCRTTHTYSILLTIIFIF